MSFNLKRGILCYNRCWKYMRMKECVFSWNFNTAWWLCRTLFCAAFIILNVKYVCVSVCVRACVHTCSNGCLLLWTSSFVLVWFHLLKPTVTWCTNSLTFNNCTFCPHCIYVFCIYLWTNSDLWHLQLKLIGFYNRDEKCLLRGTNCVFE